MSAQDASGGAKPGAVDRLVQFGDIISKLALVAGGVFALVQFMEAQRAAKVSRTAEYIQRYEEGGVAQARRAINAELRPYLAQFKELDAQGGVSAADRSAIVLSVMELSPNGAMVDNVDTVIDFYEGLATCVRENLCDARVARNYFGDGEAREFWSNFEPYVAERRTNNASYAEGLEQLALH